MTGGPYKLPAGWRWVQLGEVCSFRGGTQPPKSEFQPVWKQGFIRLLQIRDFDTDEYAVYVKDSPKLRKVDEDDVLIGRYGASVGRILRGRAGAINVAIVQTIPNESHILKDYLYYLLSNVHFQQYVRNLGERSAQAGFNQGELKRFPIPLPPLAEQRRIVARIEELMARVREARRLREQAKEEAERLWQSVLADTFPRPGSALPPGWRWVRLGEVCEINPRRPRLSMDPAAPTTFVPMSAVDDFSGAITEADTRPFAEVQKGYTYFEEGDVLFAKITPCMENGKSAIARGLIGGFGFGSTEFHVLRPTCGVTSEWVWCFVRRESFRGSAKAAFRGGVGQQRVPAEFLREVAIPLPPLAEQRRIVAHLEVVREKIGALRAAQAESDAALTQLEKSILDKAFRGELLPTASNEPSAWKVGGGV